MMEMVHEVTREASTMQNERNRKVNFQLLTPLGDEQPLRNHEN